ncbi:hypothetical protein CCB81_11650 [Armatimonadetes bacterium Uphvl-Ar2]|nr:hypothetical protein CCB81_11650 [Armatimonadetes bacterium Uphvl-Ar2]
MNKFMLVALATVGCGLAFAQPANYIDLGNIGDIDPNYQTEDAFSDMDAFGAGQIKWFKFTFGGTNGTVNYLDIDTINVAGFTGGTTPVDTEIGLYDNLGNRIADDDDDGYGLFSSLSFGAPGSRNFTQSGTMSARGPLGNGRDGVLASGTYWLAVGQFNAAFGNTNWTVTSTGTGDVDRSRLAFRTDVAAVPEPFSVVAMGAGLLALARRRRNAK